MSDFMFNGTDYIDMIKTDEDLKLFNRLKELEPQLMKPASQCLKEVLEAVEIMNKLEGKPKQKIIVVNNPKLN